MNIGKVAAPEEMSSDSSPFKRYGPAAAGAAAGTALAAGGLIAARPALRSEFLTLLRRARGGASVPSKLPDEVVQQAKAIAKRLRREGFNPKKHKIGIGASGGTGKSTLADALSKELGIDVRHLDVAYRKGAVGLQGIDLPGYLAKAPIRKGTVAEQSLLLNQVDPDQFHSIIHIEKPVSTVHKNLINRGRSAYQAEYLDTAREQSGIRHAFDAASGTEHQIAPGVRLKVRGPGGFGVQSGLEQAAQQAGIDPTSLSQEQLAASLATGARTRLGGNLAYVNKKRVAAHAGLLTAGGVAGAATGKVLGDRGQAAEV